MLQFIIRQSRKDDVIHINYEKCGKLTLDQRNPYQPQSALLAEATSPYGTHPTMAADLRISIDM